MYAILTSILNGLEAKSEKIKVVDHQRIMYMPASIGICMCGHKTVFTRGGEVILTGDDLDQQELNLIFAIRGLINSHDAILARRSKVQALYNSKEEILTPEPAFSYSKGKEKESAFEL